MRGADAGRRVPYRVGQECLPGPHAARVPAGFATLGPAEMEGGVTRTVKSLLDAKGRSIYDVAPDATVYDALNVMAEHNVGAVLVCESQRLVGIISERDYARKIILLDRASRETSVAEIMTSEVETVTEASTVDECMALMTEGHFRHLPVLEDDMVVGVISIGDVVKTVIEVQKSLIGDLERYITG